MKKKILIGSIIAVVILILMTFTSVVGFQSVKSNSKIHSPLFKIRSERVSNTAQKRFLSNYIGKEDDITISFPTRDNKTSSILKIMNNIINMDDETFHRFIDKIEKSNQVDAQEVQKVTDACKLIRKISDKGIQYIDYKDMIEIDTNDEFPTFDYWFPGCIILVIMNLIATVIAFTGVFLLVMITINFDCIPCPSAYSCNHQYI